MTDDRGRVNRKKKEKQIYIKKKEKTNGEMKRRRSCCVLPTITIDDERWNFDDACLYVCV